MCITIVCQPGCDVIRFEVNLTFLLSRFATWPKSQDKNLNILRTKRSSEVKQKAIFIIFKMISFAKNCLLPKSALLRKKMQQ